MICCSELKGEVVVTMFPGSRWLRSSPKMLGIDYPDSDEEDVMPATQPEVRLTNVHQGLLWLLI